MLNIEECHTVMTGTAQVGRWLADPMKCAREYMGTLLKEQVKLPPTIAVVKFGFYSLGRLRRMSGSMEMKNEMTEPVAFVGYKRVFAFANPGEILKSNAVPHNWDTDRSRMLDDDRDAVLAYAVEIGRIEYIVNEQVLSTK